MLDCLLNFGPYTLYILSAYLISLIVLLGLVIVSLKQRAYYIHAVKQLSEDVICNDIL